MTNQSTEIKDLVAALAKAQGEMKPAIFNKVNPHYKNRYADFASCMDACRIPLSNNGLSVMQYCETIDDKLMLVTMLAHISGQWIKSYYPLYPSKMDSQSIGSAITYGKRYSLSAMIGLVSDDDDDDGNASMPEKLVQKKEVTPSINQNITSDQIVELTDFLLNTPEDFQNKFWAGLKGMNPPIKRMADIPTALFETIKKKLLENQNNPIFVTK